MKYFIRTFGCQMNEAESEKLAAVLEEHGYKLAEEIEEANVVIINSCSVRESAENRVFGLVRNLEKLRTGDCKPASPVGGLKIVLTGCMVGSATAPRRRYSLPELRRRLPQVDYFLPNLADQPSHLDTAIRMAVWEKVIVASNPIGVGIYSAKRKCPALVPIMRGCDHFCSYCVVPYARGAEASRPFEEIVGEVEQLAHRGCREVLLLGQNVNSYKSSKFKVQSEKLKLKVKSLKKKFKTPFALLLAVLHEIPGIEKISFLTSNPWDLADDTIEAMSLPKIDRYLHLPVQSGDDTVLKKMNRPYTAEEYRTLVEKVRKRIPDIEIGTDLIVGFPGETKAQFENTVKLCKKVGFVKAYIARYSPRPGTAAFKLKDGIPPDEKKRRWRVLEKLINQNW